MKFIKGFAKIFVSILTYVLAMIIIFILTMGIIVAVTVVQSAIFVPDEFIIWVAHDSGIRIIFIFEAIFVVLFLYFMNRKKLYSYNLPSPKIIRFVKKYKVRSIAIFSLILIMATYYMIVNMSAVSSDKIVRHTFSMPKGKEYSYSDVKAINTGVYGSRVPFVRSKGEFYYIVEFNDGSKINLNNSGGTKDDRDIYLTIMELDKGFVDAGISKEVDSRYVELCENSLAKIYSDRIKNILENVKKD